MENKVELVGYYGGDVTHCNAAWTSTNKNLPPEKQEAERQQKLLNMLAKEGHHTPFERSLLHFSITADTATHIHILKHRTVAANGESARYKEVDDKYYIPDDWPDHLAIKLEQRSKKAFDDYHSAIAELEPIIGRKRAKESARYFLPYASQVKLDISMSWRAFSNFYNLRAEKSEDGSAIAQEEINAIAEKMMQLIKDIDSNPFGKTIEAFGY